MSFTWRLMADLLAVNMRVIEDDEQTTVDYESRHSTRRRMVDANHSELRGYEYKCSAPVDLPVEQHSPLDSYNTYNRRKMGQDLAVSRNVASPR